MARKAIDPAQKEMAFRLHKQGLKCEEIAEKVGVCEATIRRWGAKTSKDEIRAAKSKKVAEAIELRMQGLKTAEIADRLGTTGSTVSQYLRSAGFKRNVVAKPAVCPYSPDCFSCPMADCKLNHGNMARINALETDNDIRDFLV